MKFVDLGEIGQPRMCFECPCNGGERVDLGFWQQPPRYRKLTLKTFSITLGARAGAGRDPQGWEVTPQAQVPRMKSITLNIARSQAAASKSLPGNMGRHAKRVDGALLGKHTRQLYNRLTWKEASVLARLRTILAR